MSLIWNPFQVCVQFEHKSKMWIFSEISFHIWLPRIAAVKFSVSMRSNDRKSMFFIHIAISRYKYSTSDLKTVSSAIFYFTLFAFFVLDVAVGFWLVLVFLLCLCSKSNENECTSETKFRTKMEPKYKVNWWKPLEIHSPTWRASEKKNNKISENRWKKQQNRTSHQRNKNISWKFPGELIKRNRKDVANNTNKTNAGVNGFSLYILYVCKFFRFWA